MKKILSIICALSILMSVLIIPSAFTISAEGATTLAPTALRNMTETTVENETVYAESAYGLNVMVFDYEIEAGYYYLLNCDFMGAPGAPSYGKPISATTHTDSTTTFGGADRECVVLNVPDSKTTWGKISTIIKGDDLLKSGGKYFSIFYCNSDSWDGQFKNITLTKFSLDESSLIASSAWRTVPSVDADGNLIYSHPRNGGYYSNASITFDYEIESGYTYFISFDWMGHTYNEGGYTPKVTTVASPTDNVTSKVEAAVTLGVPSSTEAYTPVLAAISGDDLLASGGKYLAINWVNLVSDPYFRNLKISKVTNEEAALMTVPTKLKDFGFAFEGEELCWSVSTGAYAVIGFNTGVALEANKKYIVSFDYKSDVDGFNGGRIGFGTNAANTEINELWNTDRYKLFGLQITNDWYNYGIIIDTKDGFVDDTYKYLTLVAQTVKASNISFKNFKVYEIPQTDTIIPTALKNKEMLIGVENGDIYWHTFPGTYKNPTFTTDFEIAKGKKYAVNFDYKYSGSMGGTGGMWFGATDTISSSTEGLIDKVQQFNLSNVSTWTNTTIFLDTTSTDVITDTNKYFAFRAYTCWGKPDLCFKNMTITEVDADNIYPIAGDKFTSTIVDGEVVTTYCATTEAGQYDTVGFTTDYALENNKEYIVAFDYKYNGKWFNDAFRAISIGSAWNDGRLRDGKLVDIINSEEGAATEWTQAVAGCCNR